MSNPDQLFQDFPIEDIAEDPHNQTELDGIICGHEHVIVEYTEAELLKRSLGLDECDINDSAQKIAVVKVAGLYVTRVKRGQIVIAKIRPGRPQIQSRATGRATWTVIRESDITWVVDARPLDWSAENREIEEMEV